MCDETTDGCEDCERLAEMVAALTAERDALRARVAEWEAKIDDPIWLNNRACRLVGMGGGGSAGYSFSTTVGPPTIIGPPMRPPDPPRPRTEDRP